VRVLVTGATGFTGSYVARKLAGAGHSVACFVRPTSDRSPLDDLPVEFSTGTFEEPETLQAALKGADALVNVASLGFGHGPNVLGALAGAGVRRAVFFSTTSIYTKLNPKSKSVRLTAEEAIMSSDLDWTLVRPTMIYGSRRDRNMFQLIRFLRKYPVMPVPGPGKNLQQPVYVEDLADAVLAVLNTPGTAGWSYNLAGAEALTFDEVIDTTARHLGRSVRKLHLPYRLSLAGVSAAGRLLKRAPLSTEQILRLNEDKAFDISDAKRDFGYAPLTFSEGIRREIESLGWAAPAG